MNIFLDDIRMPYDVCYYINDNRYRQKDWLIVRDYLDFVKLIEKLTIEGKEISLISFDHDLASEHYESTNQESISLEEYYNRDNHKETGYDCVIWLKNFIKEKNIKIPIMLCHSMNPSGKINILNEIKKINEL